MVDGGEIEEKERYLFLIFYDILIFSLLLYN